MTGRRPGESWTNRAIVSGAIASSWFGWSSYLGRAPGEPSPPHVVPARPEELSGLPAASVGLGRSDLFLDEDRDYARRLREAGVDVTIVEVDGGIHGFEGLANSPTSHAFDASIVTFTSCFVA